MDGFGLLQHSPNNKVQLADPYCDCEFPKDVENKSINGSIHDLITCRCGENEDHDMEWLWDKNVPHPECYINGANVTFHPIFSQGTSVIRGEKPLQPNMIHYWEIKVITLLSGTDVMFGIGTGKVNLTKNVYRFVSALGKDDQSWGLSYQGRAQHNGELKFYGKKISQGCIVGVYLDMFKGHLEFFLNRRSLGISYKNIPVNDSIKIYPMACSTAAKSSIKLINSTSCSDNLQFQALRILSKYPQLINEVQKMPGLKYLGKKYWFVIPSFRYSSRLEQNLLPLEDEAILKAQKAKRVKIDFEDEDLEDIYANAHIIRHRSRRQQSDEEDLRLSYTEEFPYYFCDH